MSTEDTNATRRGSESNDLLGLAPTRAQVNAWMAEAGWQNSAIRQADLDKVERVVRAAVAAEHERWAAPVRALLAAHEASLELIDGAVIDELEAKIALRELLGPNRE